MSRSMTVPVAVAILGAGLVHLAVGAGSPLPLIVVFVAVGIAELGWAGATLRADRVPAPRVFLAVSLVPVVTWAVSLATGMTPALPLGPLAAATALGFAAVAVVAVGLRGTRPVPSGDPSAEHPWRFIGTLAASAAIVAGVVTPALSGTWAGQYAEPHGSHGIPGLVVDEHAGH